MELSQSTHFIGTVTFVLNGQLFYHLAGTYVIFPIPLQLLPQDEKASNPRIPDHLFDPQCRNSLICPSIDNFHFFHIESENQESQERNYHAILLRFEVGVRYWICKVESESEPSKILYNGLVMCDDVLFVMTIEALGFFTIRRVDPNVETGGRVILTGSKTASTHSFDIGSDWGGQGKLICLIQDDEVTVYRYDDYIRRLHHWDLLFPSFVHKQIKYRNGLLHINAAHSNLVHVFKLDGTLVKTWGDPEPYIPRSTAPLFHFIDDNCYVVDKGVLRCFR